MNFKYVNRLCVAVHRTITIKSRWNRPYHSDAASAISQFLSHSTVEGGLLYIPFFLQQIPYNHKSRVLLFIKELMDFQNLP